MVTALVAVLVTAGLASIALAQPLLPSNRWGDRIDARQFGVSCNGVNDDTAALGVAVAAANTSGRSVYLPAGTCLVDAAASGVLLSIRTDHVWLKGEGAGATVVLLTGTMVLTGELDVVQLAGEGQGVEGITFRNRAALGGSSFMTWVAVRPGGFDSTIRDCEFDGGYGGNTAGGSAVTSYTPLNGVPQVNTALGTSVSQGSRKRSRQPRERGWRGSTSGSG